MRFNYEIQEDSCPIDDGVIEFNTMEEQDEWLKQAYIGHYRSVSLRPLGLESIADPVETQMLLDIEEQLSEYTPAEVARKYLEAAAVLYGLWALIEKDYETDKEMCDYYDQSKALITGYNN